MPLLSSSLEKYIFLSLLNTNILKPISSKIKSLKEFNNVTPFYNFCGKPVDNNITLNFHILQNNEKK